MPIDEYDQGGAKESLAAEFHVASRNQVAYKRLYKAHDIHLQPAIRELVTEAPLHFEGRKRLPHPAGDGRVEGSVLDAIRRRASGRDFGPDPLPVAKLATLLRHANGVLATGHTSYGSFYRRAAANSGDLGSVEIFPIILNVDVWSQVSITSTPCATTSRR